MREHIADESIDLIYLDPPFNSNRSYNILFKEVSGEESGAQITAFEDSWTWGTDSAQTLLELPTYASHQVVKMINALIEGLGHNAVTAYLVMMTARLVELHRVLKSTGSLYLHCDPTASHYLKVVMDAIFDPRSFRNEIVWLRTSPKGLASRRLPQSHDILLNYKKSELATWNTSAVFVPYEPENLSPTTAIKYCYKDPDGRTYRLDNLNNPNPNRPNLTYQFWA